MNCCLDCIYCVRGITDFPPTGEIYCPETLKTIDDGMGYIWDTKACNKFLKDKNRGY